MNPIAFEIGPLQIRYYGVMAAIGFLAAAFIINFNRKEAKMNNDQVSNLLFVTLISGILGARLFYVIQFFDYYRNDLWKIIRIDQGGLVFYGGLLAVPAIYLFCRLQKLDFLRVLDIVAPALLFSHACGRIGCFLNGCCYGKITDSVLGVTPPPDSELYIRTGGAAVHPVQIYETVENLLFFAVLMWVVRKGRRGMSLGCYLAGYGLLRFINEFFRGDNYRFFDTFTIAQLIGVVLMPLGLALIGYSYYAGKREN